jgi:hypothetical protein
MHLQPKRKRNQRVRNEFVAAVLRVLLRVDPPVPVVFIDNVAVLRVWHPKDGAGYCLRCVSNHSRVLVHISGV